MEKNHAEFAARLDICLTEHFDFRSACGFRGGANQRWDDKCDLDRSPLRHEFPTSQIHRHPKCFRFFQRWLAFEQEGLELLNPQQLMIAGHTRSEGEKTNMKILLATRYVEVTY